MNFKSNIQALSVDELAYDFNIIEEFQALNARRKLLLCEHLFLEGRKTFQGTVEMLWPEADDHDTKKLEKFLVNMKTKSN